MAAQYKTFLDLASGEMANKHGCSIAEIAIIMKCPESTVKQILRRALKKMRRVIEGNDDSN